MMRANRTDIAEAGGAQDDNDEIQKTGSQLNRGRAEVDPGASACKSKHGQASPHDFAHGSLLVPAA
jgi:hypothetical protein